MSKVDTGEAEFQGQEMAMFGGSAKVHKRTLEPFNLFEARTTRGLLRREYQVLSMYNDGTDEAESQDHEAPTDRVVDPSVMANCGHF